MINFLIMSGALVIVLIVAATIGKYGEYIENREKMMKDKHLDVKA